MLFIRYFVAVMSLLFLATIANAASFDCKLAKSEREKLVCK